MGPAKKSESGVLLARAANARQRAVGDQAGGRVFLFLRTDRFDRDYRCHAARGIRFVEAPRQESYGKVAVFEDLYANPWDLVGDG